MCDTGTINSLKLHVVSQEPAIAVYAAPSSFGRLPSHEVEGFSDFEQRFTKRSTVPKNFDETCGWICGLQDLTRYNPNLNSLVQLQLVQFQLRDGQLLEDATVLVLSILVSISCCTSDGIRKDRTRRGWKVPALLWLSFPPASPIT